MYTTRELIRRAARNLLSHRDVGRSIDPMSEEWAEQVLQQNPAEPEPPETHVSQEAA